MEINVTYNKVLKIVWPIILANISVPLLGLVDLAVIGNLGDVTLIGAIAIGSMIFSFIFWGFGFLRMGTTGLIAQAVGKKDEQEVRSTLFTSCMIGIIIGILIISSQIPMGWLAFYFIDGSQEVEHAAQIYYKIRIWCAPATLVNFVILGYFLGMQNTRTILVLQIRIL